MGQRHQFFAIARIGNRYRVVAGVHNQWLYGPIAVRQCLNTMRVLSASGNLPGIRRELKLAQTKPDDFWPDKSTKKNSDSSDRGIDFPFITTCLLLGCGVSPTESKSSPVAELSIDLDYTDCWNDDGISVFDITSLGHPKYAMINPVTESQEVFLDDESEEFIVFEPGKISNASDYMLLYKLDYKDSDNYEFPQVQALDSLPLLDVAAFNSVWPMSNFWAKPADEAHSPVETETLSLGSMRSLRDVSMRTVVEKGLESDPSDDSWFTEAEQLQGFTESFRAYLYEHPSTIQDKRTKLLLGRTLRGCAAIDLSPFANFSLGDVLAIVETASRDGSTFTLTLPDMDDLTADGLRELLSNHCIHELHIGDHRVDNLSEIIRCIDGTSVGSFTTPEMYSRRFFKQRDVHDDMTVSERGGLTALPWSSPVPTLPQPRQCCVTQMVYVNRPGRIAASSETQSEMEALPWSAIIDEEFVVNNNDTALFTLPLADLFLSPTKVVEKLPMFLTQLSGYEAVGSPLNAGRVMMNITQRQSLRDDLTVEPIPGELLAISKRNASASCSPFMPTEPLSQGRWTIVFVYEHRLQRGKRLRFRYGFATLDTHGKTRVLDAAAFLREHDPGNLGSKAEAEWEKNAKKLCEDVNREQQEWDERLAKVAASNPRSLLGGPHPSTDDSTPAELGLCSAWEVDELFTGLGNVGRLASREPKK